MACLILQKQIEYIDGKKENIVIPSVRMKQIRAQEEAKRKFSRKSPCVNTFSVLNKFHSDRKDNDFSRRKGKNNGT